MQIDIIDQLNSINESLDLKLNWKAIMLFNGLYEEAIIMKELDLIIVVEDISADGENIKKGEVGTIIDTHDGAYTIEFDDAKIATLPADKIIPYPKHWP